MTNRITSCSLVLAAVLSLGLARAEAAEVSVRQVAGTRTVEVVLDTHGEAINAIEGTVSFSGTVSDVSLGGSVIPLWLKRPAESSLSFSGVIPGGFSGQSGKLFTLNLAGSGPLTLFPDDLHAYLNDGLGTEATTTGRIAVVTVPAGARDALAADTELPEFSEARIVRDDAAFDGDWFVAFNAQDGGTGISGYEVAERLGSATDRTGGLAWRAAESPYRLSDQSRRSTVFVKARDGAGNERITTLPPQAGLPVDPATVLGAAAALLLLVGAAYAWRSGRLRIR